MKFVRVIFCLSIVFSCSDTKDFYEGYIYNENKPLENVLVKERGQNSQSAKSNKSGYFKLRRETSSDLIFSKRGYVTDTVELLRLHPTSVLFLRKQSDTLFMKQVFR